MGEFEQLLAPLRGREGDRDRVNPAVVAAYLERRFAVGLGDEHLSLVHRDDVARVNPLVFDCIQMKDGFLRRTNTFVPSTTFTMFDHAKVRITDNQVG